MLLASHLRRSRHGIFYFRIVLPAPIAAILGQRELVRSLGSLAKCAGLFSAEVQASDGGRSSLMGLFQTLRQQVGLFGELCRALAFQLGQVLQLPANARQMLGMSDAQQRPFGLGVDE